MITASTPKYTLGPNSSPLSLPSGSPAPSAAAARACPCTSAMAAATTAVEASPTASALTKMGLQPATKGQNTSDELPQQNK